MGADERAAEPEVLYEDRGGVVVITLNRPERRNALNRAALRLLREAFEEFSRTDDARVAILTGTGAKAFCAGADLGEMSADAMGVPDRNALPHLGRNLFVRKPVIAAVNGVAVGGGFLLTQMCDLSVAAESASFGITEAKWGRGAPWAAPLIRMVPEKVMMEILLTAERLDARRAYEIGLVNRVVPDADLLDAAEALARRISELAPLTIQAHKQVVRLAGEMGRSAALDMADLVFEPVYRSADAQEGPLAFTEGRRPIWTGQ